MQRMCIERIRAVLFFLNLAINEVLSNVFMFIDCNDYITKAYFIYKQNIISKHKYEWRESKNGFPMNKMEAM